MAWMGRNMLDPQELEGRFAIEDGMAYLDSIFTEPSAEARDKIVRVKVLMEALPPREADFVDLYYFRKLKQTDIADLFGVSQPTVCYRLQRATARIQFLLNLPPVQEDVLTADLGVVIKDEIDIRIMVLMWKTTCQSVVAKELNKSQGLVRHRFLRTIKKIREHVAGGKPSEKAKRLTMYVGLFESIEANLNILREVQRPVWENRLTHCLD